MERGCYGAICTVSPQANNPGDAEAHSGAVHRLEMCKVVQYKCALHIAHCILHIAQ